MRCRKVRSFLSAYSKDELHARRKVAVGEHLSNCADCREELQRLRAISQGMTEVERYTVSEEFNARLLNRIAQERFAETRTNAHFPPRRVPWFRWERAIPAVVTAAVVLLVAILGGAEYLPFGGGTANGPGVVGASLTGMFDRATFEQVQPMDKDWSLRDHMAQIDRVNRLSEKVTATPMTFTTQNGVVRITHTVTAMVPYADTFIEVRRVVHHYANPGRTTAGEGQKAY